MSNKRKSTLSPLKPKRSAGGFFTVWIANGIAWIAEDYHLYKPTDEMFAIMSKRDMYELERERTAHIKQADRIDIDNCCYIVRFECEIDDDMKLKIMQRVHNRTTGKVRFDD